MTFPLARKVGDIMMPHIVSVTVEDRFDKVIAILQAFNLPCVPVLNEAGHCFGVLSTKHALERSQGIQIPRERSAWEVCTYRALEVERDTPIETAARMLIEHHVQHLVVKENGAVVGVVSSLDLVASVLVTPHSTMH